MFTPIWEKVICDFSENYVFILPYGKGAFDGTGEQFKSRKKGSNR
jgi:hypothetical protein